MRTKILKWFFILLAVFLLFFGCEELFRRRIGGFAGSYPFVEYWDIKATEREVTEVILELKDENPNMQPPNQTELISKRDTGYIWNSEEMKQYLEKLKIDSLTPLPEKNYNNYYHDYWLYVDFYYPDTKEIVHTWIREDFDTTVTTFAFVSLSKIDNPYDVKLINRDFWYIENKREINRFNSTFVNKIQEKINKKGKRI